MKKAKKILIAIIGAILLLASFSACTVRNRSYATNLGATKKINETDSLRIISAECDENGITVKAEVDLNTLKLGDFEGIHLTKSDPYFGEIECNRDETKRLNGDDIFDKNLNGEVRLYFSYEGLDPSEELSRFLICFSIVDDGGISSTYKFLLG